MKYFWLLFIVLLIVPLYSLGQIKQKGTPELSLQKGIDIPVVVLPGVDSKKLLREDKKIERSKLKILRYAQVIDVDLSPENDGVWVNGKSGEKIWYLKILSPEAYSLGVLFDRYRLPVGAELYIYSNDQKHIRGAFTYKNNKASYMLSIAPVKGDEIIIEYHEPEKVEFKGEIHIASVAHDYKDILSYLTKGEKGFGDSGDCNVNINCDNDELWQLVKHAVCKITIGGYLCSGALINNTKEDERPYLLTANHCLSAPGVEGSANFYFNYESPDCSDINGSIDQNISGSTLIATPPDGTIDFSLLELSVKPPPSYVPYYAGWNRDIKDPTSATSIHHPRGDIKKITKSYDGATTGDYGEGYDLYKHWHIDEWDEGTTEGGSSGSPLFDPNGWIIGDLTGGDASCSYNYDDYYQQLYHSWQDFENTDEQLKFWLDPINSETVTLDGFLPYDTIPSHLKAHLIDTIVYLNWNEVIDTANIDFYYVYRNGLKIDSVKTSYYIDTLTYSTLLYKYNVTAKYNFPEVFESLESNTEYIRTYDAFTLPFLETFENPVVINDYWYEERSNDTVGWEIKTGGFTTILDTAFEGSFNAYFYDENSETSKLVLPKFDLSAYINVSLSFYLHMQEFNNNVHHLNILYKEADTLEWKIIRSYKSTIFGWEKKNISLPNLTSNYQIALEGIGLGGIGICIDSISIKEDNSFIEPVFSANKDTICIYDSIQYTTTIDNSNIIYWNFGSTADPQEAYGIGPHWIKYKTNGIKPVQMIVNDTYIKTDNDVIVVYNEPMPSFTNVGDQLISSSDVGNQWYLNDNPIDGATSNTYFIKEDGYYSVEVTNSFECNAISLSKYMVVTGDGDLDGMVSTNKEIQIFPNPNNGTFYVRIATQDNDTYYYKIIDVNGVEQKSGILNNYQENQTIKLNNPNEGIYFIQIYTKQDYFTSKILIKK